MRLFFSSGKWEKGETVDFLIPIERPSFDWFWLFLFVDYCPACVSLLYCEIALFICSVDNKTVRLCDFLTHLWLPSSVVLLLVLHYKFSFLFSAERLHCLAGQKSWWIPLRPLDEICHAWDDVVEVFVVCLFKFCLFCCWRFSAQHRSTVNHNEMQSFWYNRRRDRTLLVKWMFLEK